VLPTALLLTFSNFSIVFLLEKVVAKDELAVIRISSLLLDASIGSSRLSWSIDCSIAMQC